MTVYLLDVNVLLALGDPAHVHFHIVRRWFRSTGSHGWATCPLTENGFIRIASSPKYGNRPGDTVAVLEILRQLCEHSSHTFWPDDISIRDLFAPDRVVAHSQITDVYLLGLAVRNAGKLATLDRRIPAMMVPGGPEALEVISG